MKQHTIAGREGRLLQTVVTLDLSRWIQRQARAEGISVAAYMRRLLLRHRQEQVKAQEKVA